MRQAVLALMEQTTQPGRQTDRHRMRLSEGAGCAENKSREWRVPRAVRSHCSPPSI